MSVCQPAVDMLQVSVQLKRIARLMDEANSKVPFADHAKAGGSQKGSKKAKLEQSSAKTVTHGLAKKAKKAAVSGKSKSAKLQHAKSKSVKNKDKYNKKKPAAP